MKTFKNNDLALYLHAENLSKSYSQTSLREAVASYNDPSSLMIELAGKVSQSFLDQAHKELEMCSKLGICVITLFDESYPLQLKQIPDPPSVLFVSSLDATVPIFESEIWAIVGARSASSYGVATARALAEGLSEVGVCVVSGLAYGIDVAAHEASLDRGIAVLGSGLLNIYPKQHREIASRLIEGGGAIVSEFGLYQSPRKYYFPRRNRIISGLSKGVIVVEAREKSGSLITARLALEQGRDVFVIPGPIDSEHFRGSNKLMSDGAEVITSVQRFIKEVSGHSELMHQSKRNKLSHEASLLLEHVIKDESEFDVLYQHFVERQDVSITEAQLRRGLLELELRGFVTYVDGKYRVLSTNY